MSENISKSKSSLDYFCNLLVDVSVLCGYAHAKKKESVVSVAPVLVLLVKIALIQ